ncbi:MAG: DUF3662 domain-containing protein [Chloroflexi bacterium]|nr:DUF3662 domain-containing protein [Chloroflexota bacterium]
MLSRFEHLLEEAIEGGARRLFPARLQPIQLAKAAARALEESVVISTRGAVGANVFTLRLAPADLDRLAPYRGSLGEEVARYIESYAEDRGFLLAGPLEVNFFSDERVQMGRVRAQAEVLRDAEPAPPEPAPRARSEPLPRVVRPRGAPSLQARPAPTAWLLDPENRPIELDPEDGPLRVGRSPDNDVVLGDSTVSRYHAQVWPRSGGWSVQDLGSTNGTAVADQPIGSDARVLADGDSVRFGGIHLRYVERLG